MPHMWAYYHAKHMGSPGETAMRKAARKAGARETGSGTFFMGRYPVRDTSFLVSEPKLASVKHAIVRTAIRHKMSVRVKVE